MQVSDNDHKSRIEESPKNARTHVYYRNVIARETAANALGHVMRSAAMREYGIEDSQIHLLTEYEPRAFGLDIPEPVLREAYIMLPDLSPMIGWETGRASEPAFMDMNLHSVRRPRRSCPPGAPLSPPSSTLSPPSSTLRSRPARFAAVQHALAYHRLAQQTARCPFDPQVRGDSTPSVCLYQHDLDDPMNPAGLLIAYAEKVPLSQLSSLLTALCVRWALLRPTRQLPTHLPTRRSTSSPCAPTSTPLPWAPRA